MVCLWCGFESVLHYPDSSEVRAMAILPRLLSGEENSSMGLGTKRRCDVKDGSHVSEMVFQFCG